MAHYCIGDIQGCFLGLQKALAEVEFNFSKDTLWLTGDLIARGEGSLETLDFLYKHQDSVKTVLGNHDLHFLAVANNIKNVNPKDKLEALLANKALPKYIDWLRNQPLIQELPKAMGLMSHAGLPPHWSYKKAQKWSQNVSSILQSKDYLGFLEGMYGNKPNNWQQCHTEDDKLRFAVNALTRMRFVSDEGSLDFEQKGSPEKSDNKGLTPWFEYQAERFNDKVWIFGHWASLMGKSTVKNVIALDTGYVWGNYLSVLDLKSREITYVKNT